MIVPKEKITITSRDIINNNEKTPKIETNTLKLKNNKINFTTSREVNEDLQINAKKMNKKHKFKLKSIKPDLFSSNKLDKPILLLNKDKNPLTENNNVNNRKEISNKIPIIENENKEDKKSVKKIEINSNLNNKIKENEKIKDIKYDDFEAKELKNFNIKESEFSINDKENKNNKQNENDNENNKITENKKSTEIKKDINKLKESKNTESLINNNTQQIENIKNDDIKDVKKSKTSINGSILLIGEAKKIYSNKKNETSKKFKESNSIEKINIGMNESKGNNKEKEKEKIQQFYSEHLNKYKNTNESFNMYKIVKKSEGLKREKRSEVNDDNDKIMHGSFKNLMNKGNDNKTNNDKNSSNKEKIGNNKSSMRRIVTSAGKKKK